MFWGWKLAVRGPQEKGVANHAPRGAYTSKNFSCSEVENKKREGMERKWGKEKEKRKREERKEG